MVVRLGYYFMRTRSSCLNKADLSLTTTIQTKGEPDTSSRISRGEDQRPPNPHKGTFSEKTTLERKRLIRRNLRNDKNSEPSPQSVNFTTVKRRREKRVHFEKKDLQGEINQGAARLYRLSFSKGRPRGVMINGKLDSRRLK